jgi:hypothetical protein
MAQPDDFLSIEASDAEEPLMMSEDAIAQAPILPTVEAPKETRPVPDLLPKPDTSFLSSMQELANAFYRAVEQAQHDSTPDEADLLTSMHQLANTFNRTVDQAERDPTAEDTGISNNISSSISSELANAFCRTINQAQRDSAPEADLLTSMHHLANKFTTEERDANDAGVSSEELNCSNDTPRIDEPTDEKHHSSQGADADGSDDGDDDGDDEDESSSEDEEKNGEDSKVYKRYPDYPFSPDDVTIRDLLQGHVAVNCHGHEVQIPVLFSLMMMSIIGLSPATFFVAIGFGLPIVWLVRRGFFGLTN